MSMPVPGDQLNGVLRGALEFSETRGHNYIGTEHLLVAILQTDCSARHILRKLLGTDVDETKVRAALTELVDDGVTEPGQEKPFTLRATRALELATRAAIQNGTGTTNTQHLLLGMARLQRPGEDLCTALRILERAAGITSTDLREAALHPDQIVQRPFTS